MVKIIMHGCNGHMGQVISGLVEKDPDAEIVAGIDVADQGKNSYPVYTNMEECQVEADALIDFSSAKATDALLAYCEKRKLPVVLCTTGLSEEQLAKVEETSKNVAVLKSANMSLGINTLMKLLQDMGYEPKLSRKGNVFVTLGGDGEPLVLAAHVDTLGAMVRSIKDNGRLRPTTLGGHVWSTADGENCTIHTRDGKVYTGVVLNTEPSAHVADKKVETLEENMEILLDEPVSTKAETLALGIQTGDIIAMDPRTVITESGYIKSRFLDDKLSASILLGIAKIVKDESLSFHRKVSLLFTVYEEVGHGGSFVPEDTTEMISVDMGCVGADLGCTERMVSICAKDSGGPYNYDLVTELSNIAKEEQLDYAIDVYPHYGSDVEATLHAGYDIRHGLIGPGVYASHNYERSHLDGVKNTFLLLTTYITR